MSFYKCGHDRGMIVMDSNPLSMAWYFEWKDSAGFDGDKSLCNECWNQRVKEERVVEAL